MPSVMQTKAVAFVSRISTGILADIHYHFPFWQNSDRRKWNRGQDYQTTSRLISPIRIIQEFQWKFLEKVEQMALAINLKILAWLLRHKDRTLQLILWKLIIAHYGFIFFLIITFTHCNSGQVLQIIEDTGKLGTIWIVQIVSEISLPSLKS